MTDEHKQRTQEEFDDAALELLMNEYAETEGEALWRAFKAAEAAGNEPQAPKREDRKLSRGSGNGNRRIHFLKHAGNGFKRAAVIFLVLICLLSPLILSAEAFKIPVLNYFVAIEKKFSEFDFGTNEALRSEQEALIDLITSVPKPEGYYLSKQEITTFGQIRIFFTHDGKNGMKLSIYLSDGQINIDTEDAAQIPMKIQDYEAVYLEKNGHRLMWMDAERELIFDLRAFELEEDDFWTYAYALTKTLSQ